ncbi:coiled-coil domain-containing protein 96 [Pygocentrus nattereri]|uniref:CCDC113/CCDC96 coiled-coil domain-containing protein n=1 Tax=Pygocentrus nattereri TaxID=42514 RepID=A0A3B4E018_PYGNA|nr:coiled-coil domain-containing protein 96 [Pygocentrus nattereri]XP_017543198.1 coiled-coil domain-containing protein 96 [Pygocentrus nattereri]
MEEPSLEEVSPAADATVADSSEGHGDVVQTEAADAIQDGEEPAVPEADTTTGLEAEEMEKPAAEEHLGLVPVENLPETAELETIGEEPEEAVLLPDQTAGGDLPTGLTFEEGEAPGVDPLIGERFSREGSIKAEGDEQEKEDEGLAVLLSGTSEPEGQQLEDEAPSDQLQIEQQNLQTRYKEQLEILQELQAERDKLSQVNTQIQVKLADYFRRKMGEDPRPEQEKVVSDLQLRYQTYLDAIEDLKWQRLHHLELHQQQVEELKRQSQKKLELVERSWGALMKKKYELAVTALARKLGKPVAQAQVEQLQQAEQKQEEELVAVRLENIKLKMKTRKLEVELKAKEELAEGLHRIDFEQLKIENQTYNEKIEERSEELLKLRKKITHTEQVLTQVKEKLRFVQVENQAKRAQLAEVDAAVARKRDMLTRTKRARDSLRADNLSLRQRCGLLGNNMLLRDFEEKTDACESLKSRLETLKRRHAELTLKCAGVKQKLEHSRTTDH